MIVVTASIPDLLILEPKVFGDERGFFTRALTSVSLVKRPE